jgi:hypothetical protein
MEIRFPAFRSNYPAAQSFWQTSVSPKDTPSPSRDDSAFRAALLPKSLIRAQEDRKGNCDAGFCRQENACRLDVDFVLVSVRLLGSGHRRRAVDHQRLRHKAKFNVS